jgi:hypothetical protein
MCIFLRNAFDYVPRRSMTIARQKLGWLYDRRDFAVAGVEYAMGFGRAKRFLGVVPLVEDTFVQSGAFCWGGPTW